MGYSIQYGTSKTYRKADRNGNERKYGYWFVILAAVTIPCLILAVLGNHMAVDSSELSPYVWQNQTVREAFADFSDSVRSGEKFSDALDCLYHQILEYEDSK